MSNPQELNPMLKTSPNSIPINQSSQKLGGLGKSNFIIPWKLNKHKLLKYYSPL